MELLIKLVFTWVIIFIITALIGLFYSDSDYAESILNIFYCEAVITLIGVMIWVWRI